MERAAATVTSIWLALAVLGGVPAPAVAQARAAGVSPDPGSASDLVQWLPSESWPGGEQYDPRLGRPVRFWGAGIPLKEVFAGVREQTDGEIGFWPVGDMNERVCVNLYLNREEPPTLRELMAQLSWVTACAFGVWEDHIEPRYALLRTSIAEGALVRLEQRAAKADAARRAARERALAELRVTAFERLAELGEGLSLSRREAIHRYRGRDDLLLLALLDPARRAAAKFLLTLGEADREEMRRKGHVSGPWEQWSAQQIDLLREALQPCLDQWTEEGPLAGGRTVPQWGNWSWVEDQDLTVSASVDDDGGFSVRAWMAEDPEYDDIVRAIEAPFLRLVVDPRLPESMHPEFEIELRELLGEELTDLEECKLIAALRGPLEQERRRGPLEERLARCCSLSDATSSALTEVKLALKPWDKRGLWQLQEAVSAASGMHVVSDCFWQPARAAEETLVYLAPEGDWQNALNVLRAVTVARTDFSHLMCELTSYSEDVVGFEWGGAGDFLRFRSTERAVWRAALLPPEIEHLLDAWSGPYIAAACREDGASKLLEVPLDLRAFSQLAGELTVPQRRWGGHLIYADPSDLGNTYRHAFREIALQKLRSNLHWYALIAGLSENQWRRLQSEGLRWENDVSLRLTTSVDRHGLSWLPVRALEEGDLLQFVPTTDREKASIQITRAGEVWKSVPVVTALCVEPGDLSLPLGSLHAHTEEAAK